MRNVLILKAVNEDPTLSVEAIIGCRYSLYKDNRHEKDLKRQPNEPSRADIAAWYNVSTESTWQASENLLQRVDRAYEVHQQNVRARLQRGGVMDPWRRVGALDGLGSFGLDKPRLCGRKGHPEVDFLRTVDWKENQASRLHLEVLKASYGHVGGVIHRTRRGGIGFRARSQSDTLALLRFHRTYPCLHAVRRAQWRAAYRAYTYRRFGLCHHYRFCARLCYAHFVSNPRLGGGQRRKYTFFGQIRRFKAHLPSW